MSSDENSRDSLFGCFDHNRFLRLCFRSFALADLRAAILDLSHITAATTQPMVVMGSAAGSGTAWIVTTASVWSDDVGTASGRELLYAS